MIEIATTVALTAVEKVDVSNRDMEVPCSAKLALMFTDLTGRALQSWRKVGFGV